MRRILLTLMMCASALAADLSRVTEPAPRDELHSSPKPAAKCRRTFHPFRALRRLGKAETEFAFRLSSLGIPREPEADHPRSSSPPSPVTETSAVAPAQLGGGAQ